MYIHPYLIIMCEYEYHGRLIIKNAPLHAYIIKPSDHLITFSSSSLSASLKHTKKKIHVNVQEIQDYPQISYHSPALKCAERCH